MKKTVCTLVALASVTFSFAQAVNSGKVTYNEVIKFKINLEGENAQFAAMMPKERKSVMELNFNQDASIYGPVEKKEEEEINQEVEGGQMRIKMNRPVEKSFCDLKKMKKIEQKDFMSRKFIIESDIEQGTWKLTGNQKMILGYPCQEAVKEDSTAKRTAWFTPAIAKPIGPTGFEGLPGLVLEVNMNNGDYTIVATAVEAGKENVAALVVPTEGKKMKKDAYNKMVKEKTEEMQKEMGISGGGHGSGGNVIIKMTTN